MSLGDVTSREELLAESNSPEALAGQQLFRAVHDACDDAAPSEGLEVTTERFTSEPDGNSVNLQVIRPESDRPLPCVYYIHGGGMATMSCFDGMYRGLGEAHRRQRGDGGHGGFPELPGGLVGAGGRAVSGWPQ